MTVSFFAENFFGTEGLWITDGTVAGTHVLKTFGATTITELTMIGTRVYFAVDDGIHGTELWKSDGTVAGTTLVKDINPTGGSGPNALININGTLFFSASDGASGVELWKSDGTAAGTTLVSDINPGGGNSSPGSLTNVNGTLFFAATNGSAGVEFWKTDGTAAGTVMLKDINPGAGGSFVAGSNNTANVNGTFFFEATDGTNGAELWKSDGTAAGTVMVKDINPAAGTGSFPVFLTNVNGTLLFAADDGTHGNELWRSDGTTAGTVLVKDINPGSTGSIGSPAGFMNINGTLFFTADDSTHGSELWKSDGTAAGTVMVKDINPGNGNSVPSNFTNINGVLEFYANDGTSIGLFRSDGTAAGTFELATNVDLSTPIGFTPQPSANDFNGDRLGDMLWRNSAGGLVDWTMNGRVITASGFVTSTGAVVTPDSSWTIAGISDFNGDGNADVLWRNSDGTLADWSMNGATIAASGILNVGGVAVKPGASWTVAGTGDFDGDSRSDILWRNTDGTLADWSMNGSTILASGFITSAGIAVKPDASWSVAGIGDFDGDGRRDILWRNSSGEVTAWFMNGAAISGSGDIMSGGVAVKPDASWNVGGVGDFNHDGVADVLWRNSNGALAIWLMNGTTIASSAAITLAGNPVMPDATWHIVEIGDFNGDSNSDILWRNDNGALAEWLMNGTQISAAATPASQGIPAAPDASWLVQAKPTDFS